MPSPDEPPPWRRPEPLPGSVETARTHIRWYQRDDAEALHRAVAPHRAALLPWMLWAATGHATAEDSLQTIDRFTRTRNFPAADDFTLGIFERTSGALLGGTGLHRVVPATGEAEIGYWIHAERRGEGLCTEAVAGLIGAAFGPWGFRRIKICCSGANAASQRVAEKLGLRLEGIEQEARWLDGVGWDAHYTYAVLAHEWDPLAGRAHGA